jgi:hypothetical protein
MWLSVKKYAWRRGTFTESITSFFAFVHSEFSKKKLHIFEFKLFP